MSSRSSLVTLVVVVVATALSAAPQSTPSSQPPAAQRPPFRSEANFVRVDVFPTLQGKPVKDLALEDFQVLEDGVPQRVSSFEHVEVRTGAAHEARAEPNTIAASRDALRNPRARVFVLFLDVPHVTIGGTWQVREPLVRLLDRVLGPEDLVGIMTPRMAASDIVFARKTEVIQDGLRSRWPWGTRHTLQTDEVQRRYELCYPNAPDVAAQMTARSRERATLEALQEVVTWLRDEREERKAILTVTEGWLLYGRNATMTNLRKGEQIPGPDPISVGPDGRITRTNRYGTGEFLKSQCDADRVRLADIDNDRFFRDLMDDANRANASFYTIDPRGLPVFDSPIGPEPPPPLAVDAHMLRTRLDSMRVLASNTDGFAVLNSNDVDKGLRRISDDLTSYYLLGYYSTNTKLDGKFRGIKVTVTRPGVAVRARRGYRAATADEVATARAAASAPVASGARASAQLALAALGLMRPSAPLSTHATALRGPRTTVWVSGELSEAASTSVSAILTVSTVGATNSAEVNIAAGQRGFVTPVTLNVDATGPIDVRVRIAAANIPALTDMVRIDAVSGLASPLMFRRGASTGNRLEVAAQPHFSRTERVRFEIPAGVGLTLTTGRLLDRTGTPIDVPVTLGERTDGAAQRWATADVTLAPLAPGDYIVELAAEGKTVMTAIRVTR